MYPNVGPSSSFSESTAPIHMNPQFFNNQSAAFNQHYRSEYAPVPNWQMPQMPPNAVQHRFPHLMNTAPHSKSFSLPVDFHSPFMNAPQQQMQQPPPPPRINSFLGDVPLPPGWEAEKTSTGQIYYINHMTKTTSWEDPRKMYNLPSHQADIQGEMRLMINAMPLPEGWEEARTGNNEAYYINHATKTTSWEDPRLNVYMQQKYQQGQFRTSMPFGALVNSSSNSSICSTASSSSCSVNSTVQPVMNPQQQVLFDSSNAQKALSQADAIKKNLDTLLHQKNLICKQIEELAQQEMSIKAQFSPQELDEIQRILNGSNNEMQIKLQMTNQYMQHHHNKENMIAKGQNSIKNESNSYDMNSTIVNGNGNE